MVSRVNVETDPYLTEGRLLVRSVVPDGIRAICRGSGEYHHVSYQRGAGHAPAPPSSGVLTWSL
jgi:hypothetical protein